MSETITGQCHCGSVRWQAELPPTVLLNCHCNMCRQLSGADYSSWVIFQKDKFQLLDAGDQQSYQASDQFIKNFCRNCGSTVSCINNDKFPDHIYVARGNITEDLMLPVNFQVYTQDKANWVRLDPEIPEFTA